MEDEVDIFHGQREFVLEETETEWESAEEVLSIDEASSEEEEMSPRKKRDGDVLDEEFYRSLRMFEDGLGGEKREEREFYEELLRDFVEKMEEIQGNAEGLVEDDQGDGMDILWVKQHLLVSYCTDICFYMMLKQSGRRIENHPVIDELVRIRVMLEKLKPIEARMEYRIGKDVENKGLGYGPNPDMMDTSEEEGEMYRPAKMNAVPFEDHSRKGRKEKKEEISRKEKRSEKILRDIESEEDVEEEGDVLEDGLKDLEMFGESSEEDVEEEKKRKRRPASSKILKNRGLVPYRKREARNPRVRQRERVRKKMQKRPQRRGQTGERYRGERGIRTNVVRGL